MRRHGKGRSPVVRSEVGKHGDKSQSRPAKRKAPASQLQAKEQSQSFQGGLKKGRKEGKLERQQWIHRSTAVGYTAERMEPWLSFTLRSVEESLTPAASAVQYQGQSLQLHCSPERVSDHFLCIQAP